jgi:predicted TIM-barrel fold metal-dependent hydrolase
VVIVTPSVYGTDNRATLYGLKARGKTARGIAVIDEKTPDRELDGMASAGVVGIRLNLATTGQVDPDAARSRFIAASNRIKTRGWHLQVYAGLAVISRIKDLVSASPIPIVFDHFGGAQAGLGLEQPGFADLLDLLRSGSAYVKISGAYRASKQAPDYPDVAPFARALVRANPDRVLWGTDWPHPDTSPSNHPMDVSERLPIDDGRLLNQLPLWVPDAAQRTKILVANPARLYKF